MQLQIVNEILSKGSKAQVRGLFAFTQDSTIEQVVDKFNIWARYFFVKYFSSSDAPFHQEMDIHNASIYLGASQSFLNIAYRGASKTTRTKLFLAFCVINDESHFRKYIKILSRDTKNSTQFSTDIYNMLVQPRVAAL